MEGKKILSREAILSAQDVQREYVDMPEWGGGVYVQTLSARAGLELGKKGEVDEQEKLVVDTGLFLTKAVVDEAGNRIFTEDDISALMEKSKPAVDRLTAAALRLNNLGKDVAKEAEKN
jgi:hypothetical protein